MASYDAVLAGIKCVYKSSKASEDVEEAANARKYLVGLQLAKADLDEEIRLAGTYPGASSRELQREAKADLAEEIRWSESYLIHRCYYFTKG